MTWSHNHTCTVQVVVVELQKTGQDSKNVETKYKAKKHQTPQMHQQLLIEGRKKGIFRYALKRNIPSPSCPCKARNSI